MRSRLCFSSKSSRPFFFTICLLDSFLRCIVELLFELTIDRFSSTAQSIAADIARVEEVISHGGGSAFKFAKTETEMHNLWSARKEAIWAMCAQKPEGMQLWSTDVAVPLSRLPDIIGKTLPPTARQFRN